MDTTRQDEALRVADVADRLRVSESSVWRLLRHGHLLRVKSGRSTRIPVVSLAQFIQNGGTTK